MPGYILSPYNWTSPIESPVHITRRDRLDSYSSARDVTRYILSSHFKTSTYMPAQQEPRFSITRPAQAPTQLVQTSLSSARPGQHECQFSKTRPARASV
ncbi:hypothetical protein PoB_004198600 [Plakobranchus ocellatus]|uniref:Uncharacterized protein n=1 Tax=Plakobranchus ocellatus TaxID=259542 RepID=A0AAV4B9I2_9GAST|nr:hypothetical protein PoB_004198600 [Plakobranchus ocellatus]